MKNTKGPCPKKIWFLWFQGKEQMPWLVKKCYASWQVHNPDWELIFLEDKNINQYIEVQSILENRKEKLYPAAKSDIIRINLLEKYGGVWVDATCYCLRPLNDWLYKYLESGFFAFHRPGKDRLLSSWFLAADKENKLVTKYAMAVNHFWQSNPTIKGWIDRPFVHWFLLRFKIHGYLKKHPTLWYHPLLVKGLKVYPYFWFFYLFEKIYWEDEKVKEIWDQTPKLSADIPHKIQTAGFFQPLNESLKEEIDQRFAPLYKLTYKYAADDLRPGCTLDYLLNIAS